MKKPGKPRKITFEDYVREMDTLVKCAEVVMSDFDHALYTLGVIEHLHELKDQLKKHRKEVRK